jgi:hypothetical protein
MKFTKLIAGSALGALLVVAPLALAAPPPEHPEHPMDKKKIDVNDLEAAIKGKIAEKTKADGGTFQLRDDVLNKTWELDLVRVHRDKLTLLEDGTYFACVDMKDKKGTDVVDVDFFLKDEEGKLVFSDMGVHKVNGAPRYNWEKKGDRWVKVPLKS